MPESKSFVTAPPEGIASELCEAVADFHTRGWCLGTSGNFSITFGRDPLRLLLTRSGLDKRRLRPADLIRVDGAGAPADGDLGRPSAETLLHCALADAVGAGSVLHTHSVPGTVLGLHWEEQGELRLSGYEMLKGLAGVETHEAEVRVPIFPNTQDMEQLSRDLRRRLALEPRMHGFLIAGHGLYTWGETLPQARRHVEIFEFLFECAARRTDLARR